MHHWENKNKLQKKLHLPQVLLDLHYLLCVVTFLEGESKQQHNPLPTADTTSFKTKIDRQNIKVPKTSLIIHTEVSFCAHRKAIQRSGPRLTQKGTVSQA